MAISREKKEQLVEGYVQQINESKAIIVTDYRGLKVAEIQELRSKIREANGGFAVVKNTLARIALEEAGMPELDGMLTGPIGLGFCHDTIPSVAKAITDFARTHDALTVKGGLMGNQVIDASAVRALADLPPLDVLRAQLLGLVNAPASRLAGVVAGGVRQLVNVVNAYAEKAETGETATAAEA